MTRMIEAALAGIALLGVTALGAPPLAAAESAAAESAAAGAAPSRWSLSLSGGASAFDGAGAQPYAQIGLKHSYADSGDSYVRLSGSFIGGGDATLASAAVAADTWQVAFGGGTSFGAFSLDGYLLYGFRSFDRVLTGPGGRRRVAVENDGNTLGAGLAVTADLPLGERWFLSPFVAGDVSRVDEVVTVVAPNRSDLIGIKEHNQGVTGTFGTSLQWLLGHGDSIAGYAAFAATTNAASVNRQGTGAAQSGLRFVSSDPQSDSWVEFGASASVGLTPQLRLDLAVLRTEGLVSGDTTSGAATLRVAF